MIDLMDYPWDEVKKITLWYYEELIVKLNAVLAYPLIRQAYDHSMPQAVEFGRALFPNSDIAGGEFPAPILATFERLQAAGVCCWSDLLAKVATRESLIGFIEQHNLTFEEMIQVLNYLLRWALPFYTAARELLDHEDAQEMANYAILKQHRLMCSFDLLAQGRSGIDRQALAQQTGLPQEFVSALVQRADIARLPYVRRKTILPVYGAGYDSLAKIAAADLSKMEQDLEAYFQRTQGKSFADYKSVIILRGLVIGAKALPEILLP
jgi:hypothetical protein